MENPYQSPHDVDDDVIVAEPETPAMSVFLISGMMLGCRAGAIAVPVSWLFLWLPVLRRDALPTVDYAGRDELILLFSLCIGGGILGLLLGIPLGGFVALMCPVWRRMQRVWRTSAIVASGFMLWWLAGAVSIASLGAFPWVALLLVPLSLGLAGGFCAHRLTRLIET